MNEKAAGAINFRRNGNSVRNRFFVFLFPALLTSAATSLNTFLDSIVVAHTLGSDAMAMINMASPILFIMSAIYVLLGGGGSTVYAFLKGKMEKEKAARLLSVTMIIVGAVSIILTVIGLIFSHGIAGYLSGDMAVTKEFTDYIRVTFLCTLFIIPLQTLLMFYPAGGMPKVASIINILVNALNILFDYIFTAVIPFGLKGSAMATLTGYAAGAVIAGLLCTRAKYRLVFGKCTFRDIAFLKDIVGKGAAVCISQLGFCIKISFSNFMAIRYAGEAGVTAFSVCFQTISIISVVMGGILHSMTPIASALYGMKDYKGIKYMMKTVLKLETAFSVIFFAFLELLPGAVFSVYNAADTDILSIGIQAMRIFAIMHLFRGTVLVFMYYYQTIGARIYSMVISIADGFAGITVLAVILCRLSGINGLWLSYPLCSVLLLAVILTAGAFMKKISRGKCYGLYMLPIRKDNESFTDYSLSIKHTSISDFVQEVERYCIENGIGRKTANLAAVACEEICVYFDKIYSALDIMVYLNEGNVVMDFRSSGEPLDILALPLEEYGNMDVLMKIAEDVKYDYAAGMNLTRVRLQEHRNES